MAPPSLPRSVKFTRREYARVRWYALALTLLLLAGSAVHTTLPSITALSGLWWASTLACIGLTAVVFRLRRDVRRAMRLGQYDLEHKLGEGGMGVVYRARHALLARPTAVKVLRANKTRDIDLARFEREVRLTAQLSHPNIVTVYDYGRTPEGSFFYAMELCEGATLAEVVAIGGAMPPARAVHVLAQIAGALREAHDRGLIHRDIKPSNIIVGPRDQAKLLDFGLVKEIDTGDVELTGETSITGTPLYMAPEMIRSPDGADHRSDIYALGALGYYLLCGEHVFEADSLVEVCSGHLHDTPRPPSERLGEPLPERLEALLLQCLDKDPDQRPQSASALQEQLAVCDVSWTEHDARLWWRLHERAVKQRHRPQPLDSGRHTLQVHREPLC